MLTLKRFMLSLLLVGMVFIALPFLGSHTATAQDNGSQCQGLDLVVLVDQSESMRQNDAAQIRIYAIRLLIDSLGNNILYECPGISHRLSVIAFGSTTSNIIDTITISPQLDAFKVWEETRSQIRGQIPESLPYLGATDYRAAFEAAQQRLAQWQATPLGDQPRRRDVILIADGGPCINVANERCFATGGTQGQYMADLEGYLSPTGSNFPWRGNTNPQSIGIWMIAMNDIRQTGYNYLADANLRAYWERITSSHDGAFIVLDSSRDANSINYDISVAVADIADAITGSELIQTICTEPFYIEPYLDNAMIRILKIGSNPGVPFEEVKVSIVYLEPKQPARLLDGRVIAGAINVADYIADGPNEHYVLASPPPGMYEIEVSGADECRDLNVAYKVYPLSVEILEPTIPNENQEAVTPTLAQFDEPPYYDLYWSPKTRPHAKIPKTSHVGGRR
jgi:hypothetical protein